MEIQLTEYHKKVNEGLYKSDTGGLDTCRSLSPNYSPKLH